MEAIKSDCVPPSEFVLGGRWFLDRFAILNEAPDRTQQGFSIIATFKGLLRPDSSGACFGAPIDQEILRDFGLACDSPAIPLNGSAIYNLLDSVPKRPAPEFLQDLVSSLPAINEQSASSMRAWRCL